MSEVLLITMFKIKNYLKYGLLLLMYLLILTIAEIFYNDSFYVAFNLIMFYLIISSGHNLFNKYIMFRNMLIVDFASCLLSIIFVYVCFSLNFLLYTSSKPRGIIILFCLNQLFMYSRNNYKERVTVRKGIY